MTGQKCQLGFKCDFGIFVIWEETEGLWVQIKDIKSRMVKPLVFALCED